MDNLTEHASAIYTSYASTSINTKRGHRLSFWRDAQLDTVRLAFVKIAARVTELVTRINVSLPSSYPYKHRLARFAGRARPLPP